MSAPVNVLRQPAAPANYDDDTPIEEIELSAQERKAVLRKATSDKRAKVREYRYKLSLMQPKAKPNVTPGKYLDIIGRRMLELGIAFELDDENREVIELLCQYFAEDPEFEKDGRSLQKGLLLWGPVGCGKSLLMQVLQQNTKCSYKLIPCRKVEGQFAEKDGGSRVIDLYAGEATFPTLVGWCFDDLGTEDIAMNYGNRKDVMESVLDARYRERSHGQTHLTTNLTISQIEEIYGQRMRSRLREMCNLIAFPTESKDRRS